MVRYPGMAKKLPPEAPDPQDEATEDPSKPEGEVEVTLEDPKPKAGGIAYDEMSDNLVEEFVKSDEGKKFMKEVSSMVREDFDDDRESSEEYRERMAEDLRLFSGDIPKKKYPFENMANAHMPLMMENIQRISTRIQAEVFGDWQNIFTVLPVGPDDDYVARLLSQHGNWQLSHHLTDFKRQQARGVLMFTLVGDVTSHSYYDFEREQNVHEILTRDEIAIPYAHVTTQPDYSDLPHIIKILRMYRHQLEAYEGKWTDVDKVLDGDPPSWDDEPESPYARATAESQGIELTDNKRSNAYRVLQWEGWCDLPDQDRQRFCQIHVEYDSHAVLCMKILEEDDWQDRERFERQTQEQQQYEQAQQMFQAAQAEHQQMMQQHGHAVQAHQEVGSELGQVAQDPQHMADLQAAHAQTAPGQPPPAPQPPPMPDWMLSKDGQPGLAQPLPVKRRPLHMFGHAVCIEPLVGNLGLSFGRMQADHNRAVNTLASQFADSATLANVSTLMLAPGTTFKAGRPFEWYPGAVNELEQMPAGGLENAFRMVQHGQANPQMMELIDSIWQKAASSIQAAPVLSGEPGKSGETFRGVSTRVEQASKQLSVPTGYYADFVKNIIKNNAKLNAVFLPEEEVFMVNNERAGMMQELKLGRSLYQRNYQIKLGNDLTFASEAQRIATADEVAQMVMHFPPLQGNPQFLYEALKDALEARGKYHLVGALGPPPPPTQVPFGTPPAPPPGAPGQPQPGQPPGPPHAGPPAPPPNGAPPPKPGVPGPGGQPHN